MVAEVEHYHEMVAEVERYHEQAVEAEHHRKLVEVELAAAALLDRAELEMVPVPVKPNVPADQGSLLLPPPLVVQVEEHCVTGKSLAVVYYAHDEVLQRLALEWQLVEVLLLEAPTMVPETAK